MLGAACGTQYGTVAAREKVGCAAFAAGKRNFSVKHRLVGIVYSQIFRVGAVQQACVGFAGRANRADQACASISTPGLRMAFGSSSVFTARSAAAKSAGR